MIVPCSRRAHYSLVSLRQVSLPLWLSVGLGLAAMNTGTVHGAGTVVIPEPVPNPTLQAEDMALLRTERVIEIAREAHPDLRILSTFQEEENGRLMEKVLYTLPDSKEPWLITIDPYNGRIIRDRIYNAPSQGSIPLEVLLTQLRQQYDIVKVIRTRRALRDDQDVRIIVYRNKFKQQRILVVNAMTGVVISDQKQKLEY